MPRRPIHPAPLLLAALAALVAGCQTTRPSATQPAPVSKAQSQGYALLYDLVGSEKDVGKILILKSADAKVAAVIKDIAQTTDRVYQGLTEFAKADPNLKLKDMGLPALEKKARDAIATATSRELLFGSSGKQFEVDLLLTQVDGLRYGTYLCNVLADGEKDRRRKAALETWSKELAGLCKRVVELVSAPYVK